MPMPPSPRAALTSDGHPLIGNGTALFALAFCAVTPVQGSPLIWPVLMVLVLFDVVVNRRQLVHLWVSIPLLAYLIWLWMSLLWSVEPAATLNELTTNMLYVIIGLLIAVNRSVRQIMELLSTSAT